ncbi:hypothetical protein BH23VER1_BH23VER1_35540 [soil metagenome]
MAMVGGMMVAVGCSGGGGEERSGNERSGNERAGEERAGGDRPADGPAGQSALGKEIEEMTGAHTRVVWSWHQGEDSTDTFASGKQHLLMGIDSQDGFGVRTILGENDNYSRPLLTPDGETILFTNKNITRKGSDKTKHFAPVVYRLPWGGGMDDVVEVGEGMGSAVWADPADGRVWVYVVDGIVASTRASLEGRSLVRFPLDAPAEREVLFEGPISPDNVQVSRDGSAACALFPWPDCGILDLASGEWHKTSLGCWPSLAPDDSQVSWIFDGAHRTLQMFGPDRKARWDVPINRAPGVDGREVYHPRWANHPHFLAITGPYGAGAPGENPISKGGAMAEVCIGRFNESLTAVDQWVKLTENSTGDFYPDMWIAGGDEVSLDLGKIPALAVADGEAAEAGAEVVDDDEWPGDEPGPVFLWENNRAENKVGRQVFRVSAEGIGRFDANGAMILDGGSFVAQEDGFAPAAAAIAGAPGFALEFLAPAGIVPEAEVVTIEGGDGATVFQVGAKAGTLAATLVPGSGALVEASSALPAAPAHVLVIADGAALRLWVDGAEVASAPSGPLDLSAWAGGRLRFGGAPAAGGQMSVEKVALYAGVVFSTESATAHAASALASTAGREPAAQVRLRARLAETTSIPAAADVEDYLDTYHRALVDYTYDVVEVLEGDYAEDRVVVWHWVILDRQLVPGFPRAIGEEFELVLEPTTAHPQLASERRDEDTTAFGLDPFYDISTPQAP